MKVYVVRFEDTEQRTIIRSEFINKRGQIDKINECDEKGLKILDIFEDDL
jgi:hypothetical protein